VENRITAKVVYVTPEEARRLRQTCHFERQRAISDQNLTRLALEMRNGNFVPGTTVYFAVLPDGSMLILNGNHTLEAVAASGVPQTLVFIFNEVADIEEAGRLYGCFDIHKARTWVDALRAIGAEHKIAMPMKVLPAVGLIMQGFEYSTDKAEAAKSRQARFEKMVPYTEPAAMLQAALAGSPRPHQNYVTRMGVMAVALETLRYQPSLALEFWQAMAHDDGLRLGDPRKTLLRYLSSTRASGSRAAFVMARAGMQAWNAFFKGKDLAHCRPNVMTHIVILGTPWTAKEGVVEEEAKLAEIRHQASQMDDLFDTGLRVTEGGTETVVLYRQSEGPK